MCVCVSLDNKDTFCLYNFIRIFSRFFTSALVDEFTEIVQNTFKAFIGHDQGLFASVKF